jgi:Fur family transcriptional regulator, peroxide stress response regulator
MSTLAKPSIEPADETLRLALESNGQRFTEQRAAVYRFLCGTVDHPTADEVFTAVRGHITDISLATVYKALETLVSCNLAVKLTYGDGSARYDARTDEHFHARCLDCGSVRDVERSSLSAPLPEIRPADGFQVSGFRLELVGYCDTCAARSDT